LVSLLPPEMILPGGTAISAYLGHRVSHDLDCFFGAPDVDLGSALDSLKHERRTVVTVQTPDRLKVVFGDTKVQFLFYGGPDSLGTARRSERAAFGFFA
jgi:hypothetical protein